ncbi:MAG TPA: hypothetical protein VF605_05495 [Allosphingosinicella sp.]|jgi:hypothetical protein
MIAPALLALAWLGAAGNPPPEEPSSEEASIIMDVSADKKTCNARTARRVKFSDLASGSGDLSGRCVRVSGYLYRRALFAANADTQLRYAESTAKLEGRRVGLYGLSRASPSGQPVPGFYRVVGRVGNCENLAAGSLMVMGYCHYTSGPYLALSEVRPVR